MSKNINGLPLCMMQLIENNEALTGYDLTKLVVSNNAWVANHQQVYRDLRRLEEMGFLSTTTVENIGKPDSKLYSITEAGEQQLEHVRQTQQYKMKPFRSESAAMQMAGGRNYLVSAAEKISEKLDELKKRLGITRDPAEKLRIQFEIDTRNAELSFVENSRNIA
ncbi:MAG: hypothetical protein CMJ20_01795 [Phycisphaeraceae bacterium]|nr:hypothetical protein [Phycisphaeraceae bacterium]|tara:strand:+ start:9843 stop:10337 length:495 start_codon:yes stop_codon:yes gene_type:complete